MTEDRRTMQRFDLRLSSELHIKSDSSKAVCIIGRTINICAGGACFDTPLNHPIGTGVVANIALPRELNQDGAQNCLAIQGTIVRKEEYGVAVAFDKHYDLWTQ